MKRLKSHSRSNLSLWNGIFFFLCLLLFLEGLRVLLPMVGPDRVQPLLRTDADWQPLLDSIKVVDANSSEPGWQYQANYLNDARGYRLGLLARELDSLYAFRAAGGRLYSLEQFGEVTGISQERLASLGKRLKFPDPEKQQRAVNRRKNSHGRKPPAPVPVQDLNTAGVEELREIRGIGPVLSQRILKFRKALGGFQHESQLLDVYGLPPEVARRAMARFRVSDPPAIERINLNTATADELASLLYLDAQMAEGLIRRRLAKGPYTSIEEITEVETIPADKIERIALYLTF